MSTRNDSPSALGQANFASENGSHLQMHEQHRQSNSDAASWQDDLVLWQAECRRMIAEIKELELLVQDHQKLLTSHSEDVNLHRTKMASHEHALVEYEDGGNGAQLVELSRNHRAEMARHNDYQNCHAALKQRHHGIVAHWNHLWKQIEQTPALSE